LFLGRIFGIDVRVHATWLLTFALVTWALAGGYFRFVGPRQAGFGTPLLLGAISALLLFGSVLVHEFSHSLVARARGLRVRDITLFVFGGVSNIGGEARTARDEFLIAVVGPLTSFALAGVFWLAARAVGATPGVGLLFGSPRGLGTLSAPGAVLSYLAVVNLLLGAFNLLPGFPLDGGRVFRAILWGITHRSARATAIASVVGQVFGYVMAGLGIIRLLVLGDLMGGLWTIFIGWFLSQAAVATRREQRLRESVRGVRVGDVMDASPATVEAGSSLQDVVFEHLLGRGRRRVVVVRDGRPLGLIEAASVGRVPRDRWPVTPCAQVAQPIGAPVSPETELSEVLQRLTDASTPVPVVADDRLVGLVDLGQVLRYAQLRDELQVPPVSTTRPATA
jgi:Zn-dependent protease